MLVVVLYENWVFTVTGSFSLVGVFACGADVGGGDLFDVDDAFICRIFILDDNSKNYNKFDVIISAIATYGVGWCWPISIKLIYIRAHTCSNLKISVSQNKNDFKRIKQKQTSEIQAKTF